MLDIREGNSRLCPPMNAHVSRTRSRIQAEHRFTDRASGFVLGAGDGSELTCCSALKSRKRWKRDRRLFADQMYCVAFTLIADEKIASCKSLTTLIKPNT
jgi:hypothetical protein